MIDTLPELDRFVDAVLAYRPPKKKKKLNAIAKGKKKNGVKAKSS